LGPDAVSAGSTRACDGSADAPSRAMVEYRFRSEEERMTSRICWAGVPVIIGLIILAPTLRGQPRAWAIDASVTILSPADGASVSGTVTVKASMGPDAWWAHLKVDGELVATSPPYTFTWDSTKAANGSHTLKVDSFLRNGAVPVASQSVTVSVNNSSGSTVYFSTLAPGASLPGEAWCANNIPATPETISINALPNSQKPSSDQLAAFREGESGAAVPVAYLNRVDGNYTGSTDMILRWAACKWGIDENMVRAEAWGESAGVQAGAQGVGDWTSDSSRCPPGSGFPGAWDGTSCGQSYGILQVKYIYQPYTWPMIRTSTAFNVDYRFAVQRACMNGDIAYLAQRTPDSGYPTYPNGNSDQMLWGCIGQWYSGGWYDDGALGYIDWIRNQLSAERWKQ
jgi:hypothetical protein